MRLGRKVRSILTVVLALCAVAAAEAQERENPRSGPSPQAQWFVTDGDLIARKPLETVPFETPTGNVVVGEGVAGEAEWIAAVDTVRRPGGRRDERIYLYHNGTLAAVEEERFSSAGLPLFRGRYDPDGAMEFEEHFRYRSDGSLREVRRCDGADQCITIRYGLPSTAWDERLWSADESWVYRYDGAGRPEYIRREQDDVLTREEWYTYPAPATVQRRVREGDEVVERLLRDGRVVEETVRRSGRIVRTVQREYDQDGRITEEQVIESGRVQVSRWEYESSSGDGGYRLYRTVDGVPVLEEYRDDEGSGTTIRYRNGDVVVRETFRDDELVQRETFADGEVIRTETW